MDVVPYRFFATNDQPTDGVYAFEIGKQYPGSIKLLADFSEPENEPLQESSWHNYVLDYQDWGSGYAGFGERLWLHDPAGLLFHAGNPANLLEGNYDAFILDLKLDPDAGQTPLYLAETEEVSNQEVLQSKVILKMPGLKSMVEEGFGDSVAELVLEQNSADGGQLRVYDASNISDLELLLDNEDETIVIPLADIGDDEELPLIVEGAQRGTGQLIARLRSRAIPDPLYVIHSPLDYSVFDVSVTWEELNSPIDDSPKLDGSGYLGKRIFPDKPTPEYSGTRNTLYGRVTLDPPTSGVPLFFKIFDVDDATPASIDQGGVIDDNGKVGNDNFGSAATLNNSQGLSDQNGQVQVEVTVGMQPGDNYRLASAFNQSKVNGLTVIDPNSNGYVTADDDSLAGFNGSLSPMLTVWRKLWIEYDSMTGSLPTGPYEQSNIDSATIAAITHVSAGGQIFSELTPASELRGDDDQFQGGYVNFADGTTFEILSNTSNKITVRAQVPMNKVGDVCKLHDDDWLTLVDLKRPLPYSLSGGSVLTAAYKDMFIEPETVSPSYTQLNIPFDPHVGEGEIFDDYQDLSQSNDFWYANMVAAWQAEEDGADADPDSAGDTYGLTDFGQFTFSPPGVFGFIYVETIREHENGDLEQRTIAHEIGHTRGLKHDNRTLNLMHAANQGAKFTEEDIRHVRENEVPEKEDNAYE
jgi:hypothetical protein